MTAKLVSLIECQEDAGEGTQDSPFRTVSKYFTTNGDKVVKYDPCSISMTPELFEELRHMDNPLMSKPDKNEWFNIIGGLEQWLQDKFGKNY